MRDPAATAGLLQCVNHSDATVRQASIQALGEIGRAEAVPALARALADPDQGARVAAVWALGNIPGPESTAALQEAARSEDPKVGIPARARLRRRAAGY
jgi:HEAT repeat protein